MSYWSAGEPQENTNHRIGWLSAKNGCSRCWISTHVWFKKYVLEPSLKQINEHTDITASYEQHKKGRTITGFSFKFKQKKKTEAETPKNSDSSPHIKKPSQIPTNIVKQPENAKKDDLGHRASKITGLIMSNGLADRFKRGDESVMDMMKRIKRRNYNRCNSRPMAIKIRGVWRGF